MSKKVIFFMAILATLNTSIPNCLTLPISQITFLCKNDTLTIAALDKGFKPAYFYLELLNKTIESFGLFLTINHQFTKDQKSITLTVSTKCLSRETLCKALEKCEQFEKKYSDQQSNLIKRLKNTYSILTFTQELIFFDFNQDVDNNSDDDSFEIELYCSVFGSISKRAIPGQLNPQN